MEYGTYDDYMGNYGNGKGKIATVIGIIVAVLLAVVATTLVLKFAVGFSTTKTLSASDYSIGAINAQGKVVEDDGSIYTKDYFTTEGLDIRFNEEGKVSYQLYFYDEDKDFLSSTTSLTTGYSEEDVSEDAEYFRIVITPLKDKNGVVSNSEVSTYAGAITVTFNK
jgi:hypothetical protein